MLKPAEIEKLALALPNSKRAKLAYKLMASLPDDLSWEVEGYLEANRRCAEMDADPSACLSLEEFEDLVEQRFPALKRPVRQVRPSLDPNKTPS